MKRVLVAAVLLTTLSCSDATGPGIHGSVAFTYTGAGAGSFSAAGDAPPLSNMTGPPTATSWAVGYIEGTDAYIAGSTPRSGGLIDLTIIRLSRTSAGSATVSLTCNIDGSASCTGMEFYRNFNGDGDTGDFFCRLTTGTIIVTEMSSTRAKGTFSGNGNCVTGTGGTSSAFSVTNGMFDVAMVAPPV
jgi:hypothetical protein